MPVQDLTPSPVAAQNGAVKSSEAGDETWVWAQIKAEARRDAESEPTLARATSTQPSSPAQALCCSILLYNLFLDTLSSSTIADLPAARERDLTCSSFSH
ncbi:probable serine acetyltransferase 1 [Rhododendron vialii]|uniref:probable serine acetyltransferase 1 n=1 Tax=Rhododendron vialii TaxID=182163 RepID=UPI00265FA05B|nr:probable serine acetyltransferase 1 [Rhododendron vialii]